MLRGRAGRARRTSERLLEIFLLPGLGVRSTAVSPEDNPELMDLHRALCGFGRVTSLLHMPDIDRTSDACTNVEPVIGDLVGRLRGAADAAVVVGYSIGGYLAFEACRRLEEEGAPVRLLLMVDSSAYYVRPERTRLAEQWLQSVRDGLGQALISAPFLVAMHYGRLELARRWLVRVRRLFGSQRLSGLRLRLLVAYWFEATERFTLRPYAGRVLLLKARTARPRIPDATLGWEPLAPALQVSLVEGDHWSVLRDPDLIRQVSSALAGLEASAGAFIQSAPATAASAYGKTDAPAQRG